MVTWKYDYDCCVVFGPGNLIVRCFFFLALKRSFRALKEEKVAKDCVVDIIPHHLKVLGNGKERVQALLKDVCLRAIEKLHNVVQEILKLHPSHDISGWGCLFLQSSFWKNGLEAAKIAL